MISRGIAWLLAMAVPITGAISCLAPSFEGFKGNGSDAGADVDETGTARDSATPDAARDAPPDARTFACDTKGLRCLDGFEFCCGQLLADSICKKPPIGTIDCAEVLSCGDRSDCSDDQVCCYDKTTARGACAATFDCAGPNKVEVCDKQKTPTTCTAPTKCTGVLSDTVPFCQ